MTSRQPAGIPVGGQFAPGAQARPSVYLGDPELEVASLRVRRNAVNALRGSRPPQVEHAATDRLDQIEDQILDVLRGAGAPMLDEYIEELARQQREAEPVLRRQRSPLINRPDVEDRRLAALRISRVQHHRDELVRQQAEQAATADPDASPRAIRRDLRKLAGRQAVQSVMAGVAARHAQAVRRSTQP